jgi:hypothetical protein
MDTNLGKATGLTQTAVYTADITQGPSVATGSTNTNKACVHQRVFVDSSTTNTSSSGATIKTEVHQSIAIKQNSMSGANYAINAVPSGSTFICSSIPNTISSIDDLDPLSQVQELYSLANSRGKITQNQNALANGANLSLDIQQNQGGRTNPGPNTFFGNATGANFATSKQTNTLTAIAVSPVAPTQVQSSPGTGGVLAAVNQDSRGVSLAKAQQVETQCEDAMKVAESPAGCHANDPDNPYGSALSQTQYGPLRKAPGDSSQTGNGLDKFKVVQTSQQDNDTTSGKTNAIAGGVTTDGTGTITQNTIIQGTQKKNIHAGDDTTINGNMDCGNSSCTKNLSPPTLDTVPTPQTGAAYGPTLFEFSNVDDSVTFVCSLDNAPNYTPCSGALTTDANGVHGSQTYSSPNLSSGAHTFSVKTKDPTNGNPATNTSAPATYSWVITPPDPTITPSPADPSTAISPSFTLNDADPSALFKCKLDTGAYASCTSPVTLSGLSTGSHTFYVKATDASGTYESTNATSVTWTASIAFDGTPGINSPPSTLGPHTMTAFGADSQAVCTYDTAANTAMTSSVSVAAGTIGFDQALNHDHVGSVPPECWATWSHSYTGDVYDTIYSLNKTQVTITLPSGTRAFYLYAEPNQFSTFDVTATAQDGTTSNAVSVDGSAGAKYFGFYELGGTAISSITVTSTDTSGFAIGQFGISVPGP